MRAKIQKKEWNSAYAKLTKGKGEAALRQAQGPGLKVTKARVKQPFGRLRD